MQEPIQVVGQGWGFNIGSQYCRDLDGSGYDLYRWEDDKTYYLVVHGEEISRSVKC